jgi:uncharacterized SAM-binding protein YcdF (DUF218 family)
LIAQDTFADTFDETHNRAVTLSPSQVDKKKGASWRRRLGFLALTLVAWSLFAWVAAHALIVQAELSDADALVVLSGSSAYVERTQYAARLWREGRAPRVLLTNDSTIGGWSEHEQRNPSFAERAVEELRRAGVGAEQIEVLPAEVTSTYEEAVALRDYAVAHKLRSLLVVTSSYHSRRALWTLRRTFQGSGIHVGLDAVAPGQQMPAPATWWWHPLGWRVVALEYVKLGYYVLRHR